MLTATFALSLGISLLVAPASLTDCSSAELIAGSCPNTVNTGSQIDVSGSQNKPGKESRPHADNDAPRPPTADEDECTNIVDCDFTYEATAVPVVTLSDLASFVPAKPTLGGEPNGVGVVGMPTNLVAAATTQEIPGELFDYEVVVRFVPTGFRFDYGDGSGRSTATGGASWASLGQADFTPTPTSHVYRERGTYRAGVTVLYSAAVDFGNGWIPIDGFVEATTSGYGIRVVEVRTALVDKTCLENPEGPGC